MAADTHSEHSVLGLKGQKFQLQKFQKKTSLLGGDTGWAWTPRQLAAHLTGGAPRRALSKCLLSWSWLVGSGRGPEGSACQGGPTTHRCTPGPGRPGKVPGRAASGSFWQSPEPHPAGGGSPGGGGRPACPWGLGLWERWAPRADGPSGSGVQGQPAGLWVFPASQAPSTGSRGLWVPTTEVLGVWWGKVGPSSAAGCPVGQPEKGEVALAGGGEGSSPVGPGRGSGVWVATPSHPGWVGGLRQRAPTHPKPAQDVWGQPHLP